jgi:ferredoxin
MRYFRAEYEAHVLEKRCPARQCRALRKPEIIAAKCKGCTKCAQVCPTNAIHGERKGVHTIDDAKCIKCGACATACRLGAIAGI